MQIPLFLPPPPPPGHPRTGAKYRAYTEDDMARAEHAIAAEGLSLRQASQRFRVPKTTLAERLGDRRPRPPPRMRDDAATQRTRYQWTEADMAGAVAAVTQGGDAVGAAARRFGVPPSLLNARARGRAPRRLRAELSRLTLRQEGLLADWAAAQGALGCPPTKDELFGLADRVLRKQGAERRLGKQWIVHWMRRYPQIEVLEWQPKEDKEGKGVRETRGAKGSQRMDEDAAITFTFEPVDLDGICYDGTDGV